MPSGTGDAGSKAWTPYIFDFHGNHDQFHDTELEVMMREVRNWAARNAVVPKIEVHPRAIDRVHLHTNGRVPRL